MNFIRRKKGSMIVEAAITLPVFIILVVTFCWLVKACALEIAVYNAVENEIRQVSVIGAVPVSPSVRKELENIRVDGSGFRENAVIPGYSAGGIGGFTKVSFTYDTGIHIPLPFVNDILLNNSIIYRGWNGYSYPGQPMGFDAMAAPMAGDPVYVFPQAGEKYHKRGCRVMSASAEAVVLNADLRSRFGPCPLCTTGKESNGTTVYIFRYGTCYHRGGCSAVSKYFILMDRSDAQTKGYTACSVCGG